MYTYNIAVCDDEDYYREEIIKLFTAYQSESGNQLYISDYASGEELLKDLSNDNKKFQIIILDVEMNGITGIEVAKEIRKKDKNVAIIFATSFDAYALDAFDVEAIGYLIKPVAYTKLKSLMSKAIITADYLKDRNEAQKRYLDIIMKHENIRIEIDRILYIEKRRNISIIHTKDREYSCYETLLDLHEKLDTYRFVYCHQGYIVNFDEVKDVGKTSIFFDSHLEVPVSRKYYKELRIRFLDMLHNVSVSI